MTYFAGWNVEKADKIWLRQPFVRTLAPLKAESWLGSTEGHAGEGVAVDEDVRAGVQGGSELSHFLPSVGRKQEMHHAIVKVGRTLEILVNSSPDL